MVGMDDDAVEGAVMTIEEVPGGCAETKWSTDGSVFCLQEERMKNKVFATLEVAGKKIRFLVDSGATSNVVC